MTRQRRHLRHSIKGKYFHAGRGFGMTCPQCGKIARISQTTTGYETLASIKCRFCGFYAGKIKPIRKLR